MTTGVSAEREQRMRKKRGPGATTCEMDDNAGTGLQILACLLYTMYLLTKVT